MAQPVQTQLDSRKLKLLSGPSKFYYFNNIIGKRILLLGEAHDIKGICQNGADVYEIHHWLRDLALTAPECLDIFVEKSYQTAFGNQSDPTKKVIGQLSQYSSPLSAIKSTFNLCHTTKQSKKKNCVSEHLRYHYIDARGFKGLHRSPLLDWYLKLGASKFNQATAITEKLFELNPKIEATIYDYLLGLDRSDTSRLILDTYLYALSDLLGVSWNKKEQSDYMKLYYNLIDKETVKLSDVINPKKFFGVLKQIYLESSSATLSNAFIIPQDVYFLLRLFMKYDVKKLPRGPLGCQNEVNRKVKNAIVHAGGHHIKIYERFIRKYFGIQPNLAIENNYDNKCIQLPSSFDFFQPLKDPIKVSK